MKTTKMFIAGIALMSALSVSAQTGRPTTRPTNAGQTQKALVHDRNAERKTAHAEQNLEARKHGAETAKGKANEKALANANDRSVLKDGDDKSSDPRKRAEKRQNGDNGKRDGKRGKSEDKRKDK